MPTPKPPKSYQTLPFTTITISHNPPTAQTATDVLLIRLNRPTRLNAATAQMVQELLTAYEYIDADERVRAIVLTGAGKAFSTGADLGEGVKEIVGVVRAEEVGGDIEDGFRDKGGELSLAIHNNTKPTIAAINGPATGFGITLTLPATIRVATTHAPISFPFSRFGICLEACSSFFLPRLLGLSRALHVTATGATYPASHPLLNGLFSDLLPTPEATVEAAMAIAGDIARHTSAVSGRVNRDLLYRGAGSGSGSAEEAHLVESRLLLGMLLARDGREGVRGFVERREPVFRGVLSRDAPVGWPWWGDGKRSVKL